MITDDLVGFARVTSPPPLQTTTFGTFAARVVRREVLEFSSADTNSFTHASSSFDKLFLALLCEDNKATDKGNVVLAEFSRTGLSAEIALLQVGDEVTAHYSKSPTGVLKVTQLTVKTRQFAQQYLESQSAKEAGQTPYQPAD